MKRVHFVGIGGVGTGSLAVALSKSGFQVSGSDGALYEPMKGVLSRAQIRLIEGFRAETAATENADIVVIGNVVRADNVEAMAWIQKGARFISFPEAVRQFVIQEKASVVCTGTHGKTTTTSWTAMLLKRLGADPSYLIGGVPLDLPDGCAITAGGFFVGEGDEYDSAFFDKGPKFLHYNPQILLLANIEFDHADIYRDIDHVRSSFEKVVAILPRNGVCIARSGDPQIERVIRGSSAEVETFGEAENSDWRIQQIQHSPQGVDFGLRYKGRDFGSFRTVLFGAHNVHNLVSGLAACYHLGFSIEAMRPVVNEFRGCRRRQQILLNQPIVLIDDFAHHPTEVAATLGAIRLRYPDRKIWALFEPRSATARRGTHQEQYKSCFGAADQVVLSEPYRMSDLQGAKFEASAIVETLQARGKDALWFSTVDDIVKHVSTQVRPSDVVVVMSNGEFGRIQEKLMSAIQ